MGACGSLNVREAAIVNTWTDRDLRQGPVLCFWYPCYSVHTVQALELKLFEYVEMRHIRDPAQTKYVFGPALVQLENPWQQLGPVQKMPQLDQNDYIEVTSRSGEKRNVVGPTVYQPTYGETWSPIKEALIIQVNEYVVVKDNSNREVPIRHIRGPTKYYPQPYDEILPAPASTRTAAASAGLGSVVATPNIAGMKIRPCLEVNDTKALHVLRPDGRLYLIDRPQFYMPEVGETVAAVIEKTILKEAEFAIIISPTGENQLKLGKSETGRAFFLPPYYTFLLFKMGPETLTRFSTLPVYLPYKCMIRTSDNVLINLELRVSFSIFEPELYVRRPIEFYDQVRYYTQNDLLDAYAKVSFRDFLRTYADAAVSCTQRSHAFFNEYGIKMLDVQVINFGCESMKTQELLEKDVETRVAKQNELRAKETDIEIMTAEKTIRMQQKDVELQYSVKDNEMAIRRKDLDVSLRLKEVELQISEERARTELMEVKRSNAVKEGGFEGQAQGEAIRMFFASLPAELTVEDKVGMWHTLRDMERSAMLYSKVDSIQVYPPGAEMRKLQISLDDAGKGWLKEHPLLLPSILGYQSDAATEANAKASLAQAPLASVTAAAGAGVTTSGGGGGGRRPPSSVAMAVSYGASLPGGSHPTASVPAPKSS